ncbi:MAG TPA: tetratricopeptide repeat protein, partial [Pyrinomonadaceae bacterium]|nr:tetratricopeptide repeat protein [Pyrinomonadaceae bacterium]
MMRKKYLSLLGLILILTAFSAFQFEVNGQSRRDQNRAKKIAGEGDTLFNRKDYRSAINKYAEAITIYPNFPEAHFWKGYAHYYLNEYDSAVN